MSNRCLRAWPVLLPILASCLLTLYATACSSGGDGEGSDVGSPSDAGAPSDTGGAPNDAGAADGGADDEAGHDTGAGDGGDGDLGDTGPVPDGGADAGSQDAGPAWRRTPGAVKTALVFVPSAGAGTEGVAVHVAWPESAAGARYPSGAPVVVAVPGGQGPGELPPPGAAEHAAYGFVSISLMFPGGSMQGGIKSGGTYDYRGAACLRAVADVVRFAAGSLTAATGPGGPEKTIDELVGYPVLKTNIGLAGMSHGGNAAAIALSLHGDEMDVAWFLGWENPSGDQYITVEVGGRSNVNPYYQPGSCTATACGVDYGALAIDPATPDRISDAVSKGVTPESADLPGTIFFDANGNGRFDAGEYSLRPGPGRLTTGGPLLGFNSVELTQALEAKSLVAGVIATAAQADAFWQSRDASRGHWAAAVGKRPGIAAMILGSAQDHVQATPDHPHIKVQYDGWRAAGAAFVRLNPDAAYLAQLGAGATVDNDANMDLGWADVAAAMLPEIADTNNVLAASGIEEMADRVQAGNFDVNLDLPIWY